MIVNCPKCKVKLKVDDEKIKPEGLKVRCPKCQVVLLVRRPPQPPIGSGQAAPPREERYAPGEFNRKKILIAHDGEVIRTAIEDILKEAGYEVIPASDGVEAILKIEREQPFLALLDVALPKIYGFEVCKQVKSRPETKGTLIMLLASIYDATRYKREPESLYGADDYIEKHHIEDSLLLKIRQLIERSGEKPEGRPAEKTVERPVATPVLSQIIKTEVEAVTFEKVVTRGEFKEEEISHEPAPSSIVIDAAAIEKARRFARIIISDIALYNQRLVEEGIRNDNFYSLLGSEIHEGRKLYNSRVTDEIITHGDYYKQAIDEFIEKKRKTMGHA